MMLRCWCEDPLRRPTFTEIREDLEEIMSQGDLYISFGFDENPNYFSSPSLNSVLSEHEEDDLNVDEIANEPIILEAIVHCEPSEPISVEENIEVHSL